MTRKKEEITLRLKTLAAETPEPRNRIIGCIDLLGTKSILEERSTTYLARQYARALELLQEIRKQIGADSYANIEHMIAFSDSLFVFSRDDSAESLLDVSDMCNSVFQIFLFEKLLTRGAIAKGECIIDPATNIYVGMGLVKAFLLQEAAELVGVVCEPALMHMTEHLSGTFEVPLLPAKRLEALLQVMPIEFTEQGLAMVGCPRELPELRKVGIDRVMLGEFIVDTYRSTNRQDIRTKIENSIEIVTEMLDPKMRWDPISRKPYPLKPPRPQV